MASDEGFVRFLCAQTADCGIMEPRKMFGEWLVYCNGKPSLLVCDNRVFVKVNETTVPLLGETEQAPPYPDAKPHYVVDSENQELLCKVVTALERVTPLPKKRRKA